MGRYITGLCVLVLAGSVTTGACSSDSGGGTAAGGGSGGSGGVSGTGGSKDAGKDSASDSPSEAAAPSCTDKTKNGTESDVDCGGSCPSCGDGKQCGSKTDCTSGVCQGGTCQAPSCTDGVKNGSETGVDCGGTCPASYHGFGCVTGTAGSQVCSSFPNDGGTPDVDDAGKELFDVTISWNAAGGNAYVDYLVIKGSGGTITYNSSGVVEGSHNNICTSGAYSESFKLPLGDDYTYEVWHAYCVKQNACSGCGSDVVVAQGGPFGIAKDVCK